MKTRLQSIERKQHRPARPGTDIRADVPLSLYRRLSESWVVNALVLPLLISLFGAIVTLLLTHWGK